MATPNTVFNGYATALPANADLSGIALFNVKNYGAKGDGVTDDTAAIQAAINAAAAAGGGRVWLPYATYVINTSGGLKFNGCSNVRLMGPAHLLNGTPGSPMGGLIYDSLVGPCSNVRVEDIVFDLNGNTSTTLAVYLTFTGYSDVVFERCTFIGNNGGHQAMALGAAIDTTLSASFTVPATGASGTASVTSATAAQVGSILVLWNTLSSNGPQNPYLGKVTAINGTSITVTTIDCGNTGSGGTIASGVVATFNSSNVSVRECQFENNVSSTYGDLELYGIVGFDVSRNYFYNHQNGSTANAALFLYNYCIDSTVENNRFVGNYSDILIQGSKNIILTGNSHRGAINAVVAVVNSQDIRIAGNRITGTSGAGTGSIGVAIYDYNTTLDGHANNFPNSNRIAIHDNDFDSNYQGVLFPSLTDASKNMAMFDITVTANRFSNAIFADVRINAGSATGIAEIVIRDNVVSYPNASANFGAILISGNPGSTTAISDLLISGNKIYGAASGSTTGIVLSYPGTNYRVIGNDLSACTTKIALQNSSTMAVARDNIGYNPVGATVPGTAFALAASGSAWTNNTGVDGALYVTAAGTVTAVSVQGVSVGASLTVGQTFRVKAGGTFTVTYSVAPTLVFVGD